MHEEEMEGYVGEAIDPREAEEHELEVAERLHIFASRLNRLVSEQVAKRSQIEQRWLDDIRQYHGEYASERSQGSLERKARKSLSISHGTKQTPQKRAYRTCCSRLMTETLASTPLRFQN